MSALVKMIQKHGVFSLLCCIVVLLAIPLLIRDNDYLLRIAINILLYSVLATSLNMINGYSGQFNIGQAGFYCIGAYTAAILATRYAVGFWLALPVSGLIAAASSIMLGIPTARLRGIFLAICTLGFSEIVRLTVLNWVEFTRGPMGIPGIPFPSLFGYEISTNFCFYYLILSIAAVTIFVCYRVLNSRIGRAWIAIREDELAAKSMGIPTTRYKIYNLAFGTFWAGVAGCFYAYLSSYVSADSFTLDEGFAILCMVLVGGAGSLIGPIIGAFFLVVLPEMFRFLAEYRLVIFGLAILVTMHVRPQGIAGGGTFAALRAEPKECGESAGEEAAS